MGRAGLFGRSPRQVLVVAGAAAVLLPLLAAFLAGPAAGLTVSLLLTLGLLAAIWRMVDLTRPAPMEASSPDPRSLRRREGGSEGEVSSRVLLVEDDPVSRRIVLRMLQRLGVEAEHVEDGRAAVEAVAARQYALVLMDCQLPVLDGYAAAAEIRRQEAAPVQAGRVPIVAVTASSLDADRDRCLAAGMDDVLTKPLDLGRLAATLTRWQVPHQPPAAPSSTSAAPPGLAATAEPSSATADPSSGPAGAPPSSAGSQPAAALPILDPAGLPLVDGRLPEPYREIVQLFQQEAVRRMATLTEAAARSDRPLLVRVAHTLAGSASSIGAARLAAASAALEALAKQEAAPATAIAEATEAVRGSLQELDAALARLTAR